MVTSPIMNFFLARPNLKNNLFGKTKRKHDDWIDYEFFGRTELKKRNHSTGSNVKEFSRSECKLFGKSRRRQIQQN